MTWISFNESKVYDYLEKNGHVFTIRHYPGKKAIRDVKKGKSLMGFRVRLFDVDVYDNPAILNKYVKESGFDTVQEWTEAVKRQHADRHKLYLLHAVRTEITELINEEIRKDTETKKEYRSNLCINSETDLHKQLKINDSRGVYSYSTGIGIVFLDSCNKINTWETDFLNLMGQTRAEKIFYRFVSKWKRREANHYDQLERKILRDIIEVDFHEYIHHFLRENNIPIRCCEHKRVACWLCNFTHRYWETIELSPEQNKESHPELLNFYKAVA